MAHYEDLDPGDYSSRWSEGRLAVGWLSVEHPFPAELLDPPASLVERPVNLYRGTHECDICPPAEDFSVPPASAREVRMRRAGEDHWHQGWMMGQRAVVDGRELELGNGEIQICGEGSAVYVAPTMILHYIIDHHYLPPAEFIQAVRVGRMPDFRRKRSGPDMHRRGAPYRLWIQAVAATASANASHGVMNPRVFRGLVLSDLAMASSCRWL